MRDALPIDCVRAHLGEWDLDGATIASMTPGATADVFLLTRGAERFVAKYAYDSRAYFETGLIASEAVAAATTFPVATPRLTATGERVAMVEWPPGHLHPLAVLEFVPGEPLDSGDPACARVVGVVCGQVHRALLEVNPESVGSDAVIAPVEGPTDGWDLGEVAWLNELSRELNARAADSIQDIRWSIAVWDGPDIRVSDREIGLIDFGHTFWQPLVHAVANRSLVAAYGDLGRLHAFRRGVAETLPLTDAEEDVFDLYRLINATIYARWAAVQEDPSIATWLDALLSFLRSHLPSVGLAAPA